MALIGNTVRVRAEFRGWDKALADPTDLALKFYARRRTQLGTAVAAGSLTKVSAGIYYYDYTIPDTASPEIIYEFSGTLQGMPIVGRGEIPVRWE